MAEKKPEDGISPEELDEQELTDLPNREAMSIVTPSPVEWTPDLASDSTTLTSGEVAKIAPAPPPMV